MRGKGVVERAFSSVNTLFCQHVAGYVGSDVTRRGDDVQAAWTIRELADLFEEWVIAGWQNRPHDGLRSPFLPGKALSPNEIYALLVARTGYLPVCLAGDDYIELLPVEWRKINDYGIRIDYRTYDCRELGPCRRQPSGVDAKGGLWEVHKTPTTCRMSGSATPVPEDGSPSRGPARARYRPRSLTSPGATPAPSWLPAGQTTPTRPRSPQRWTACSNAPGRALAGGSAPAPRQPPRCRCGPLLPGGQQEKKARSPARTPPARSSRSGYSTPSPTGAADDRPG